MAHIALTKNRLYIYRIATVYKDSRNTVRVPNTQSLDQAGISEEYGKRGRPENT